jgi:predicted DNA-binding transcriptional regulator AlpA
VDQVNARLYGVSEIAALLGEKPNTVYKRFTRRKMPPPTQVLAMGPVWSGHRIERWIEDTIAGRKARAERETERAPASSRGQTGRNA